VYDQQTGNLLMDLNSSSAVQMRYLFGNSQNEYLGRQDGSGNTSWYLTDRLGSVIGLTNGSGTATDTIGYDGFGNMTSNSAPTVTGNIGFQGMFTDPATGQSGSGARQGEYNPTTGSWTNPDPSGLASGSNPYEAMGNNPTDMLDPTGLDAFAAGFSNAKLAKDWLIARGIVVKGIQSIGPTYRISEVSPSNEIYHLLIPPDQMGKVRSLMTKCEPGSYEYKLYEAIQSYSINRIENKVGAELPWHIYDFNMANQDFWFQGAVVYDDLTLG
jgi:RHS repeat-associated protein